MHGPRNFVIYSACMELLPSCRICKTDKILVEFNDAPLKILALPVPIMGSWHLSTYLLFRVGWHYIFLFKL